MIITSPKTEKEFQHYYKLRWLILRKPWKQPEGSEKDDDESISYHAMAVEDHYVLGVARLQFFNDTAQLRYMAVDDKAQGKGIGRRIVEHIEQYAKEKDASEIFLHARENAVKFYEKLGYKITEKSYLLFDSIQHFKMMKKL